MTWLIFLAAISIGCIVWSNRKLSAYKAKAVGSYRRMVDHPAKNRAVEIDTNIRATPIVFQDFLEPLPETLPVIQKGRGSSNESYVVNLTDVSCTCTNWESDRCRFAKGDIRRICKHLAGAFLKHDLLKPDFMWLLQHWALFPFPAKPYCAAVISATSGQFRAIHFQGVEWVDVLADTGLKTRPLTGSALMSTKNAGCMANAPPIENGLGPRCVVGSRAPPLDGMSPVPKYRNTPLRSAKPPTRRVGRNTKNRPQTRLVVLFAAIKCRP